MIDLRHGDCREVLATLPADSVHCVVTSPPYYGLRDYNVVGQIGLEPTPDAYLAEMVAVFREVKRVLRPDGTCWVNMGDSYASSGRRGHNGWDGNNKNPDGTPRVSRQAGDLWGGPTAVGGIKPKDMLMMPARLALALQADGWWLRSDIIWHKPNPMPESVTDRPTSSHEHVFLLAKSARYWYDADAVREERNGDVDGVSFRGGCYVQGRTDNGTMGERQDIGNRRVDAVSGRNLRNVWTIATQPYAQAHFATYPAELASRCIRAGTSERGCCAACGAPWIRVTEKTHVGDWRTSSRSADLHDGAKGGPGGVMPGWEPARTTGWAPSCACDADTVPCTVLDPFAGAGTTLLVADRLQRDAIGIELNPDYTRMAMQRCRDDAPLFASPPPASDDAYDRDMRDLFAEAAE